MDRYRLYMGQACLSVELELEPLVLGGVPLPPTLDNVLDMHRLVLALLSNPLSAVPPAIVPGNDPYKGCFFESSLHLPYTYKLCPPLMQNQLQCL